MGYSMIDQLSSIGMEPRYNEFKLSDDSIIGCTIIDTNGADRYRVVVETVYKDTDGILIVYDITNRRSFEEIEQYYIPTLNEKCKKKNFVVMLVGNKKDMEDKRKVTFEEGNELASKYNFLFYEVSGCENINVFESFQKIIESTYYEKRINWNNNDDSISLSSSYHKKLNKTRRKCC
jgi:Ras-related protein Rab-1A